MPTGVDRVCLAYLRHFGSRSQAVIQHDRFRGILSSRASQDLFGLLQAPSSGFRAKFPATILRHLGALNRKGENRLYLNVGHTGLNSDGFRNWVSRSAVRPVYLVHDLIPIMHPRYCRPGEDERHRERMRTVLRTATGVIGNSQATIDDLAHFAAEESLPMPNAHAAWLGVESRPILPQSGAGNRPTFIVLGTVEARKNHLLLLRMWLRLIDRLGDKAPRLLIIGQRGWEADEVFDLLDHCQKLRGHVVELNHCSDAELARHLASATALLFPTFSEGYGLPLIEALAAGLPAIASDLPIFREICGDIPAYLSPLDEEAWEKAVLDFAQPDSSARSAQIKRMKGFHAPTSDEHFDSVETWLRTLG